MSWRLIGRSYLVMFIWLLAMAILVAGIGGEITAIAVLYRQRADNLTQTFVFWSTVGIILLAACTPGWAIMRAFYNWELVGIKISIITVRESFKKLRESNRRLRETERQLDQLTSEFQQSKQTPTHGGQSGTTDDVDGG
jgi:hypothetical protein